MYILVKDIAMVRIGNDINKKDSKSNNKHIARNDSTDKTVKSNNESDDHDYLYISIYDCIYKYNLFV